MNSTTFYQDLQAFRRFEEATQDRHYHPAPEDWAVVIADVVGSTAAIEGGRYKDVNTIGAASIVAVCNALKSQNFPYVFGGDGATFLLPRHLLPEIAGNLLAVADMAVRDFGLQLRVGAVALSEIRARGREVSVAKFQLVEGAAVAFLRGGGINLADRLVKEDPLGYALPGRASAEPDLRGLSCRWQAIPSRRGSVLSLLAMAQTTPPEPVYADLLLGIQRILGEDFEAVNPVHPGRMRYRSVRSLRAEERRLHRRWSFRWLSRLVEIVAAVFIFRYGGRWFGSTFRNYQDAMRPHSDYRKFDDMLRMVIDCSAEQNQALRALLESKRGAGRLYYGLHESDSSLMTCFVENLRAGGHVHFIDGNNGGYALAARQLKRQVAGDFEKG